MKKVNISISQTDAKKINQLYPLQKDGLETAVQNYLAIRDNALRELQGIFTREELIALVDMYNATIYDPRFAGPQFLQIQIEDAEQFESTVTRQGANLGQLIEKVKNLTHAQSLVLIEECWRFWNVGDKQDLEDFVRKLS